MQNQNPNRLLKCYGKKCSDEGITHKAKDLLQSETNKAKRFCAECFEIDKKEREEKKKLDHVVFEVFKLKSSSGIIAQAGPLGKMIAKQISSFNGQGMSIKNIRMTLEYMVNIRGMKLDRTKGLGLVPLLEDEMKKYWLDRREKSLQAQAVDKGVIKIKMKPPERKFDYQQTKLINLEELANGIKQW